MKKLARLYMLIFGVLLMILFSCNLKREEKQYVIGFSQCVESDIWRKTMLEEMKRELSFHPNTKFLYREANGNSDKQVQQVKELLSQRVDLLIISPNEAVPLTPIVEETFSKGIPVIVVDRKIATPMYSAFVGGNNYMIGKRAGEYAIHLLSGKGNIIEVTGLPKSTPAIERDSGFVGAFKNYPGIKVIKKVNGEWYRDRSKVELAKVADTYKDADLIFAQNDMMALSAYEVYHEKGLPLPKIIGIDGLPKTGMQFIADKKITASMLYPTGGQEAMRTAFNILNGENYKKENLLQTTVIDSTNVGLMQLQSAKVISQQEDIERQQRMIKEQERIYRNQRTLLYVVGGTLVLALGFGGLAFYSLGENRKINRLLRTQNEEISKQKDQIVEMSAKAEAANEAKTNFFTNISHEFRTPLTLILGPLEELMSSTRNNPGTTQSLNLIQKNVIRLLRMVNQIIDFRKVEVNKMKLRATQNNLVAFIAEIMHSYKSVAQKRSIDLRMITKERELSVWFDANMLDKVIFNLLSNSFKFTKDNGHILVYVLKDEENNRAIIKVEDDGIGMSAESVSHAFEAFYQGEQDNYKGSGLGLSLSKELIDLHKGTIAVKSEKAKGTTFSIELPLGKAHLSSGEISGEELNTMALYEQVKIYTGDLEQVFTPGMEANVLKNGGGPSILVVEDHDDLRTFLAGQLTEEYEIFQAENSQSALQQAFDIIPDLIICDVVIPGKDGIALTTILKNDLRTSHIPIILLTAKSGIEQQIEGIRSMADAYITKPFNVNFLKETIKGLLNNRVRLKDHFSCELPAGLKSQTSGKLDRKFISEFTSIVESGLTNDDFNVEDICKSLGISRVQLYRKVKALLNVNVNDYILTTRLQKAKYMLQHEELTISEIAYKVGFSSPAYFSTVFKSKFGVTPKAFKEK